MEKNNKKPIRQIMFHIGFDKNSKIRNEQVAMCKAVSAKLEMMGYKPIYVDEEYIGPYFLTIFDDQYAAGDSSITSACCMASRGRRPLPVKGLYDHFDGIMDKRMNSECWILLEKIAREYNDNR